MGSEFFLFEIRGKVQTLKCFKDLFLHYKNLG